MGIQHGKTPAPAAQKPFRILNAASHVTIDSLNRVAVVASRVGRVSTLGLAALLPRPLASATFIPGADSDNVTEQDVRSMTPLVFDFNAWKAQGNRIRSSQNRVNCIGNLSIALSDVGPVLAVELSGAAGALSLLPTAGALIGAPAKELWVLFKLMPLAGVLSMLLSLGGNIVPTQTSDYKLNANAFSYDGFIATSRVRESKDETDDSEKPSCSDAKKFAKRVKCRANKTEGEYNRLAVGFGIGFQLFWLAVLLTACWFLQSGSVVAWCCQAWGWALFWYLMVAMSSLLENFVAVPFKKQWTLRISKAPGTVRISEDAPVVAHCVGEDVRGKDSMGHTTITHSASSIDISPHNSSKQFTETKSSTYATAVEPIVTPTELRTVLLNLEAGYNTTGRVIIDRTKPYSTHRTPFYVIISQEEISHSHATLRVISKAISVAVYAAGTATFASATFITIAVALIVLCLVLCAGVFGRVVAMWMASEMMKADPVLHQVVRSREDADEYIESILAIPGLTCEIMGHIIVNGRCIKRYNKWSRISTYLGVLAPPYDITKLAVES